MVAEIIQKIRDRLNKVFSDEEQLEEYLKSENIDQSTKECLKLLNELKELNQGFYQLLLSDNAEKAIETAEDIIKWERDVATFLNSIRSERKQIERSIKRENYGELNQIANYLRNKIKELRSQRENYNLYEDTDRAIMLLADAEEIKKETKWLEKAIERLERDGRLLSQSTNAEKIGLEVKEVNRIERNLPLIHSQIERLEKCVKDHNEVQSISVDFHLDAQIALLENSKPEDERVKAEFEYLISLLEELEDLSQAYKDTSNRREFLIKLLKFLTLGGAGTGGGAKAADDFPRFRGFRTQNRETQHNPDTSLDSQGVKQLDALRIKYKTQFANSNILTSVKFVNTSDEIIAINSGINTPPRWKIKDSNLKKLRKNNGLRFHLIPGDAKTWEFKLSPMAYDPQDNIVLDLQYGKRNQAKQNTKIKFT